MLITIKAIQVFLMMPKISSFRLADTLEPRIDSFIFLPEYYEIVKIIFSKFNNGTMMSAS
jgi:hypothetical protein